MFACIYSQKIPNDVSLAEFAYAFSPMVEETTADIVVIDTEGCELIFGSPYELANEIAQRAVSSKAAGGVGCKVNVALAANPDAAIHAARFFNGITYIAPGEELTSLGDLPVKALRPYELSLRSKFQAAKQEKTSTPNGRLDIGRWTSDERKRAGEIQAIFETLRLWGVRTFRDFADLPVTGVSERLGQEGVKLQQLASGKTERHLKLKQSDPEFTNSIELEHALAELEPLAFIFARLLNQICASLNAYALATNEICVLMKLEDATSFERKLSLPFPMCDHKVFLKLLLLDTEMHPPPAPVIAVSISCEPVKPRVIQNGLFIPLAPQPEKLELTLARLAKLVGAGNIGSPELIDTHRPDAFRLKRFGLKEKVYLGKKRNSESEIRNPKFLFGFRTFRPPLRAMVEAAHGYPTQISAWSRNKSVYGKVVRLSGPWRATGDWWRNDFWARDEWDVAVEKGSAIKGEHTASSQPILCRIYRELSSGSWFVEGIYD